MIECSCNYLSDGAEIEMIRVPDPNCPKHGGD